MERIICLAIGYLFGMFQTSYIIGKSITWISVNMEAAMQELPMPFVLLEKSGGNDSYWRYA